MPDVTPAPTVEDRLAHWIAEGRALVEEQREDHARNGLSFAWMDVPTVMFTAALDAMEAALSTGLILDADNAAGADETKRTFMCEGAALHMKQVREAITEALTGRTEEGGSNGQGS